MPNLPKEHFAVVFERLNQRRIGFVRSPGNVGDRLIELATEQLFADFGIRWSDWSPESPCNVDELVYGGGGNMGTFYRGNWHLRTRCLQTGLPVTILPQSFITAERRPFRRVYVRERASRRLCPSAELAPDLALALRVHSFPEPTREWGIFLRRDRERRTRNRWRYRDPVRLCRNPSEYLALAAKYEKIVTDRLHFAVCGILLGRDTTLLPNSYHKNVSMHETWLHDLGGKFAESVNDVLPTRRFLFSLARRQSPSRAA